MMELFLSGGVTMWPLLAVAVGIAALGLRNAVRVWEGREPEAVRRGLHTILFWGAMSALLGLVGTVTGFVIMTQAIALAGAAEPSLVWGGVGVALVTSMFGLVIFLFSALVWFVLRQWSQARTYARAGGGSP
jgi:biopolymer transport protein ExbB/TolQ